MSEFSEVEISPNVDEAPNGVGGYWSGGSSADLSEAATEDKEDLDGFNSELEKAVETVALENAAKAISEGCGECGGNGDYGPGWF
jgi:hypothetical protein